MHTVEVSYSVEPSYRDIMECLSPKSILQYKNMYEIESCEHVGERVRITASFEAGEMVFEFAEIENGYEYTLVDGTDLFAERHSRIMVDDGSDTRITAVTQYTLDTWLSFILDRLAASTVQNELEMTITNLVDDALEAPSDST